jgi:hypothetical protein
VGFLTFHFDFFLFSCPCFETDFEGPSSLRMQWRRFEQQMITLFRMLKLDGCWIYDPDLRELVPVWDGTVTFGCLMLSMSAMLALFSVVAVAQ